MKSKKCSQHKVPFKWLVDTLERPHWDLGEQYYSLVTDLLNNLRYMGLLNEDRIDFDSPKRINKQKKTKK